MAEHTPGPWEARFSPEGELVAHWDVFAGSENLACLPETTQEPDARLIAAAPRMYDFVATHAASGDNEAKKILEEIHGSSKGHETVERRD